MKNLLLKIAGGVCLCLSVSSVWAQPDVRREDYFWSKRVVNRIALGEKINQPMVAHQSAYYSGGQYSETQGIVVSLVNGVKKGKYLAYHPDDWSHRMNYPALESRMKEFDQALTGAPDWADEPADASFTYQSDANGYSDEFSQEWKSGDGWAQEVPEQVIIDEWGSAETPAALPAPEAPFEVDYGAYEEVIHLVEDWIFDKNTSNMVKKIDFFEIIWVDPSGILPDKVLARFKYADVRDQLDQTMWKNRFNDAEIRSLREIFELRIFNGILINVGGEGVMTLQEADRRKQEMIEFEHHLWNY
jgi:hypothetical protein